MPSMKSRAYDEGSINNLYKGFANRNLEGVVPVCIINITYLFTKCNNKMVP